MAHEWSSRHGRETARHRHDPSATGWAVACVLLSFLGLTHLFVMAFVLAGWPLAWAAPPALAVALACGEWLARKEEVRASERLFALLTAPAVVAASLAVARPLFDMSWDGLWYHQTAVYQIAAGWNPLADPMREFVSHLQDWVRHYAKGPWYVASALYAATGDIEAAKAAPWIALVATFCAVLAAALECGLRRPAAALVAALVALNPVVVFELASYLVDGLMVSFLACFVAAMFVWFRKRSPIVSLTMVASAVLCINAKQTGLVYLCFACAAGGLYAVLRRRDLLGKYVAIQAASLALGVVVFGFNPYVTNWAHRGHPLYPMLGTAAHPGLAARGEDPIERWETPRNMLGRNRVARLGYAVFGRPGAPPYFPGKDAVLMLPFHVGRPDFAMYYFHDVRISGFGPLFSGALLLGLVAIGVLLARAGAPRTFMTIALVTIVVSLLISPHTWWARYGPQLWWVPVLAVAAGLTGSAGRLVRALSWAVAVVLLLNVIPIAVVHFRWEIDATRATHRQMAMLRTKEKVDVDFQYFGEPFGARLKAAGVRYRPVQKLECAAPTELMSVSPGYPMAVRACVQP